MATHSQQPGRFCRTSCPALLLQSDSHHRPFSVWVLRPWSLLSASPFFSWKSVLRSSTITPTPGSGIGWQPAHSPDGRWLQLFWVCWSASDMQIVGAAWFPPSSGLSSGRSAWRSSRWQVHFRRPLRCGRHISTAMEFPRRRFPMSCSFTSSIPGQIRKFNLTSAPCFRMHQRALPSDTNIAFLKSTRCSGRFWGLIPRPA